MLCTFSRLLLWALQSIALLVSFGGQARPSNNSSLDSQGRVRLGDPAQSVVVPLTFQSNYIQVTFDDKAGLHLPATPGLQRAGITRKFKTSDDDANRRPGRRPERRADLLAPEPEVVAELDRFFGVERRGLNRVAQANHVKSQNRGDAPSALGVHKQQVQELDLSRHASSSSLHHADKHADKQTQMRWKPDFQVVGTGRVEARIGLTVHRGPDWRWGNQDGGTGSIGVVVSPAREGWCNVRWPSSHENGYRVGVQGAFDLRVSSASPSEGRRHSKLIDQSRGPASAKDLRLPRLASTSKGVVAAHDARIGLAVQRGPHWQWGNQDGGVGSVGIIVTTEKTGWCTVRWPSGCENGYRVGVAGRYDLEFAVLGPSFRVTPASHRRVADAVGGTGQPCGGRGMGPILSGKPASQPRLKCWCLDQFGDIMHLS
eukprot:TRINITY_DN72016_c0_g1_i1.p1 TRINITY_DN72016_c0_g1~~TRINITY_DN72016_c0_g1_i1.p1  ORF type:complete len:429 (+),score=34.31 TRINITY_DN72016_c0_g1_i1:90-1376(+)